MSKLPTFLNNRSIFCILDPSTAWLFAISLIAAVWSTEIVHAEPVLTVGSIEINSNGNCNIIIGVNHGEIPDRFECIQTFLDVVRDEAELSKLNLEEPIEAAFWMNIYDGAPTLPAAAGSSHFRLGSIFVANGNDIDFEVLAHLRQTFKVRFQISELLPGEFNSALFTSEEEAWNDRWSPATKITEQIFIPSAPQPKEYVHIDGCNMSTEQYDQARPYFEGADFRLRPVEMQSFPCSYEPYNTFENWSTEQFAPISANGFWLKSNSRTADVIEEISKGRLYAEIVYHNVFSRDDSINIQNHFEYLQAVFRFVQVNRDENCASNLEIDMFPKMEYVADQSNVTVIFREIESITYESCLSNPF